MKSFWPVIVPDGRAIVGVATAGAALALLAGVLPIAAGPPPKSQMDARAKLPRLVATILLPGVNGRIDHLAFDPKHERLFVAALGNNSLEVIDLRNLSWSRRIEGLREPQGVVYIPGTDEIVVSNGGDGTCRFFDAESLAAVGEVSVGDDPDNVRFDAIHDQLLVGFGDGGLASLDPGRRTLIAKVKLPGHPESFQVDPSGFRAFVNVPGVGQVVVADLKGHVVTGRWPVPARSNFPMAIDTLGLAVYVACRSPASLVVFDMRTGAVRSKLPIAGDADDVFCDALRSRLYVSCGEGELDVFDLDPSGVPTPAGRVVTAPGARTCLFVPDRREVFVAARRSDAAPARILVFDVSP